MKGSTLLVAAVWLVLAVFEAGTFRAVMRHDFPELEKDPAEAREHAVVALLFGSFGPFSLLPNLMFTGAGAFGWENPISHCYWDVRPYGEACS